MDIQIPKDIPGLPDAYGLVVHFTDNSQLTYDCVMHNIQNGIMTVATKEDTVKLINWSLVKYLEFDKRWTQTRELQQKYVDELEATKRNKNEPPKN